VLALLLAAGLELPALHGIAWRNIGPAVAGGRVAAVAGTNADPNLYYFGGADGGVWKTTNGGLTWSNPWPQQAVGAIGAIAIDPRDKNVVWVGTGEPNLRNDVSYGDGLWLTRDGGQHWRNFGLRDTWAISRLAIDPRDSRIVLAAAVGNPYRDDSARGIYRTADGGRTWQKTLYLGPESGASDVAIDPRDPRIVYAGIWEFRRKPWTFDSGGPLDGIFKSVDGGLTWRQLSGGGLPSGPMGRIGLGVASNGRVYAMIQSKTGVLWRSDDGGAHWRLLTRNTLVNQRPFYMSRLQVDPSNPNHVFFSSEDLIETRDGGKTFEDVRSAVHQDHHGLWISRDGRRIIEANDGGAPISIDGGKTWDWRSNVTLAQVYRIGYDRQTPYHVCGGIQDNDSYCGPSDSLSPLGIENADWRDVGNDGDGSWVWPQPNDPTKIWNVGVKELNGQLGIYDMHSRQNYDITPDVTDTNGRALAGLPYRSNWEAPIAFGFGAEPKDERDAGIVAYYGANVLFETRDFGRTWKAISPDLTRNDPSKQQLAGGPIDTDISGAEFYDTIFDIAPSPVDPKTIWVGTDDGLVQVTADGGATWHDVTPAGVAAWGRVDSVEASNLDPQRAYVAIDRHVMGDPKPYIFATDDLGRHWREIVGGLPRDQYVHVVREDPRNVQVLYAGLEQGVWVSLDRGSHWQSLQLNMPSVAIHDMRVQPDAHDLILATHGRGFWILDDLGFASNLAASQGTLAPRLFPPRTAYTWYRWWTDQYGTHPDECCLASGEFGGDNPPDGALITYDLPTAASHAWLEVRDEDGTTVRCLDAPGEAGIDRTSWDLTVTPPVEWESARAWNRGGSGATVPPGAYHVVLHAGSQTAVARLEIKPDPRAHWTQTDYEARYAFENQLNGELSAIDTALNRLDALRDARDRESVARDLAKVYSEFTSGVVNSEDDLLAPDRLRERLTTLQGVIALSQGPPTPAQEREASAIRAWFERAMAAYKHFLVVHHLPSDSPQRSCTP
jgi:photosystem II stability/assembly factor-like uncharacterized protein